MQTHRVSQMLLRNVIKIYWLELATWLDAPDHDALFQRLVLYAEIFTILAVASKIFYEICPRRPLVGQREVEGSSQCDQIGRFFLLFGCFCHIFGIIFVKRSPKLSEI